MFPLSAAQIAEILGSYVDPDTLLPERHVQEMLRANVPANWPQVEAALFAREIYSDLTAVAAISTIAVETLMFAPIRERGGPEYLAKLYEGRADLGNTVPGDGARFCGRGYVQITGRYSYTHFGKQLGVELVGNPDLALDPEVAARVLALYFRERGVNGYADRGAWEMVRRRVNGGVAGWSRFIDAVNKLVAAMRAPQEAKNA